MTGCGTGADGSPDGTPTATDVASTASATPAPSPSATPAVASIPTDCTDIVDPATYAATMGETPLNDPDSSTGPTGQLQPSPAPAGADPSETVVAAT